jgi:uncharacterized membrane protein (UPF0136 family)
MLKKTTCWTVFAYGMAMLILGIVGYWQGSLVSLIAGAGFGILLIISSRFMFSHKMSGIYAATAFTLFLTGTFSVRYTVTQKPFPAIMAVISGGMLLFLLAQIAKWKKG